MKKQLFQQSIYMDFTFIGSFRSRRITQDVQLEFLGPLSYIMRFRYEYALLTSSEVEFEVAMLKKALCLVAWWLLINSELDFSYTEIMFSTQGGLEDLAYLPVMRTMQEMKSLPNAFVGIKLQTNFKVDFHLQSIVRYIEHYQS